MSDPHVSLRQVVNVWITDQMHRLSLDSERIMRGQTGTGNLAAREPTDDRERTAASGSDVAKLQIILQRISGNRTTLAVGNFPPSARHHLTKVNKLMGKWKKKKEIRNNSPN
jgi:hypothetical protein